MSLGWRTGPTGSLGPNPAPAQMDPVSVAVGPVPGELDSAFLITGSPSTAISHGAGVSFPVEGVVQAVAGEAGSAAAVAEEKGTARCRLPRRPRKSLAISKYPLRSLLRLSHVRATTPHGMSAPTACVSADRSSGLNSSHGGRERAVVQGGLCSQELAEEVRSLGNWAGLRGLGRRIQRIIGARARIPHRVAQRRRRGRGGFAAFGPRTPQAY